MIYNHKILYKIYDFYLFFNINISWILFYYIFLDSFNIFKLKILTKDFKFSLKLLLHLYSKVLMNFFFEIIILY